MRIRERRAEAEEELVKLFCTAREKIHNPVIEGVGNFARLLSAATRPSDWINDSSGTSSGTAGGPLPTH